MKMKIPLRATPQPPTHSHFVPAWEDEFDLRNYFACVHPGAYELFDRGEYSLACQLFTGIQFMEGNSMGSHLKS